MNNIMMPQHEYWIIFGISFAAGIGFGMIIGFNKAWRKGYTYAKLESVEESSEFIQAHLDDRMITVPIDVYPDKNGGFTGHVTGLQEVIAEGNDITELKQNLRQNLAIYLTNGGDKKTWITT